MYELPSSLLTANPINRYLINSPMLLNMKRDADGGMTLYVQNESPGKDKAANWLPAPKGPFWMSMRLYWPKDEALHGKWTAPQASDGDVSDPVPGVCRGERGTRVMSHARRAVVRRAPPPH
jgi:hypothetical protein